MSNKALKLKDYKFGFADAETEFKREPNIFENAFYDPRNIVDRLINGNEFMLIGNKGVGKTAYSAKIRSIAQNSDSLYAEQVSLENFEFKTFSDIGLKSINGCQRFKSYWDITLTIEIYKFLNKTLDFSSVESFNQIINFLTKNNIILNKNINNTINFMPSLELNIIDIFKLNLNTGISRKDINTYSMIEFSEYLLENLKSLYLNDCRNILIIDGLDDILRYEKNDFDILAGLFRSANSINDYLFANDIPIKIIILVRADIITRISDPDFNKIKRDSGIVLKWDNRTDDLKKLVNLRFSISNICNDSSKDLWYTIFPQIIKARNSWDYILEYTLNKPRDILQFLKQAKDTYQENTNLAYSEVQLLLRDYSSEYFLEEMKNELSGFMDKDIINNISIILSKLGKTNFTFKKFEAIAHSVLPEKDPRIFKDLFSRLFESGYVGQIMAITKYDKRKKKNIKKTSAIFKHKTPTAKIDFGNKFTIHRGLYNALHFGS
ncbi:TPA: hypothetical protein NGA24_003679 [Clostridioides difficile]|nr:hypothetical protein [Clostridioides difficile]